MQIRRRDVILVGAGAGLGTAVAPSVVQARERPGVNGLTVCGLSAPLALDRPPAFSWRVTAPQAAYRITCAATEAALLQERDLLWDTGKLNTSATLNVPYAGPKAAPGSRTWWRVQSWPLEGGVAVSRPSFWDAAPDISTWSAIWLASEHPVAKADRETGLAWMTGSQTQREGVLRGFRSQVTLEEARDAVFLVSAHKLEGVWLNGELIAAEGAEPVAWTTMAEYRLRLRAGANILAVGMTKTAGLGVPSAVATLLRLPDSEGGTQRLNSSEGWKTALNPHDGWQTPTFDDLAWEPARPPARKPLSEPWPPSPAMHLRREFSARRSIRSAKLHATALGAYEAWINGQRVGDQMLAPEMTDPSRRLLYQTYDVTSMIRAGKNALGFWVGDGWYGSEYSSVSRFSFGPAPCRVMARLEIEYGDGSRGIVETDDQWRTAASAVIDSEIYDGETYDARLEISDWAKATFDDRRWDRASAAPAPMAAIEPQACQPVRVTQTLKALAISEPKPGVYVFDFGQNFAGWPRLRIRAQPGDRIEMRFAEVLMPSGEVDQSNLRSALARDTYIAHGRGEEVWSPRFTYHGFRYVQVSGLRRRPNTATLEGLVGHNALPITGLLRIGDPVVEKFWRNAVWSQRSNFFGLPTDCPQRDERMGWMGDAEVFWPAAAFNMDVQAYSSRVMGDIKHGQGERGGFPDVIPPFVPGLELTSPGWADAGIVLPHTAWKRYGDVGAIRENWTAMDRFMALILEQNPNHIWSKSRGADYGDWLSVDAVNPGDPTTPKDLVATAYWARSAQLMTDMAEAAGLTAEAIQYRNLFSAIRQAFVSAFVRQDGAIGNESQTSYILPIRFGLLDDHTKREAGRRLAANISSRGDKLSTGFLGTPHILDALVDSGQSATAITLLLQREYPSWGYMVAKGATTMWERWNSDTGDVSMNSYNHYAFGAIVDFLFRRIAGIDAAAPGFAHVRIAPVIDRRLGYAGADYESVSGRIRTDWKVEGDRVSLTIEIPAGSTAEFISPEGIGDWRNDSGDGFERLSPGKHRFSGRLTI